MRGTGAVAAQRYVVGRILPVARRGIGAILFGFDSLCKWKWIWMRRPWTRTGWLFARSGPLTTWCPALRSD